MLTRLKNIYYRLRDIRYNKLSYAQEGEDLLLARIFENEQTGFYVDVGAHHPKRFSNTYLFYLKGWRGINIDAMPGSMAAFNKVRPKDINLEIGIASTAQNQIYFMFEEPAYNGFDNKIAESRSFKITGQVNVKTIPLSLLLDEYLPQNQQVYFLTVDVEGLELEVLKSNDWNKYRPKIIVVEILEAITSNVFESDIHSFLEAKGYTFYCKSPNNVFYKKNY